MEGICENVLSIYIPTVLSLFQTQNIKISFCSLLYCSGTFKTVALVTWRDFFLIENFLMLALSIWLQIILYLHRNKPKMANENGLLLSNFEHYGQIKMGFKKTIKCTSFVKER